MRRKNTHIQIAGMVLGLLLFVSSTAVAQRRVFDMATTQAMVNRNKNHYDENVTAKNSQARVTATGALLKSTNDKVKRVFSNLDRRLTSIYIVAGDALTMIDVVKMMNRMKDDQAAAAQLTYRHPLLAIYYVPMQKKIYDQAQDIYKLIALIVMSYGDINKIEASKRVVIFNSVKQELGYLYDRNHTMLAQLQYYAKALNRRNPKLDWYIDMDKRKVQDILNSVKF